MTPPEPGQGGNSEVHNARWTSCPQPVFRTAEARDLTGCWRAFARRLRHASISASASARPVQLYASALLPGLQRLIDLEEMPDLQLVEGKGRQAYPACQLVPVEQENWYRQRVIQGGSSPLFRQAFVEATGHCNFQPAGYIAALNALQYRLNTGHWGNKTEPGALNAAAAASGFGSFDPYVRFRPPPLVNSLFPR